MYGYIYIYIHVYTYVYVYVYMYAYTDIRENRLSNTTSLACGFFKCGESCSEPNEPYQTSNAAEHKRGRIRQVALDKWCHPNPAGLWVRLDQVLIKKCVQTSRFIKGWRSGNRV